jgi:hypothetical protein
MTHWQNVAGWWRSCHSLARLTGRENRAMSLFTRMREFWDQQIRLHQRYLDRNDVSGGDALDALMLREWIRAYHAEQRGESFP